MPLHHPSDIIILVIWFIRTLFFFFTFLILVFWCHCDSCVLGICWLFHNVMQYWLVVVCCRCKQCFSTLMRTRREGNIYLRLLVTGYSPGVGTSCEQQSKSYFLSLFHLINFYRIREVKLSILSHNSRLFFALFFVSLITFISTLLFGNHWFEKNQWFNTELIYKFPIVGKFSDYNSNH